MRTDVSASHDRSEPTRRFARIVKRPASKAFFRRLSIEHRVYLVGAVPIVVAFAIGIVSLFLINRADNARLGAHTVATAFRYVVTAMNERDAFVGAVPERRAPHLQKVLAAVDAASASIRSLEPASITDAAADVLAASRDALALYRSQMTALAPAVGRSDGLLADMDQRLGSLLKLTDEARQRQHASNADIVDSLRKRDLILRETQERLGEAQRSRAAIVDSALDRTPIMAPDSFAVVRIENAAAAMANGLDGADGQAEAAAFRASVAQFLKDGEIVGPLAFIDRRIKIDGTAARSLQSEVGELLTYTVEAHETEQATQNIAVETIKLASRTRESVERRNLTALATVLNDSKTLKDRIASLPIAPLIQTEMLDALDLWRDGLGKARSALSAQEEALAAMNATANGLVVEVANLNAELSSHADRTGIAARRILAFGAGIALLAAAFFGLVVGRSITRPLKTLEQGMLDRAERPENGALPGASRPDEIGLMTRATNQFLKELGKRETALRAAKERTESTLVQLQRTQRDLIRSEKLASLGQLVAGVAHEINTPLGVALTTTSVLKHEICRFGETVRSGRVTKRAFEHFVERLGDGMRLSVVNLERAARLVTSFKQVASDQASDERRQFRLATFLDEVFTSLSPLGRKGGHRVEIGCPSDLELDSYPGALAQVLTNLLTNAYTHGFAGRQEGRVSVDVLSNQDGGVQIVFCDDGQGIAPDMRERIFDPFVTTGRAQGSTGLGLHIVHNIVTGALGGRIEVDSKPGDGTRFVIDLPLSPPVRTASRVNT